MKRADKFDRTKKHSA